MLLFVAFRRVAKLSCMGVRNGGLVMQTSAVIVVHIRRPLGRYAGPYTRDVQSCGGGGFAVDIPKNAKIGFVGRASGYVVFLCVWFNFSREYLLDQATLDSATSG